MSDKEMYRQEVVSLVSDKYKEEIAEAVSEAIHELNAGNSYSEIVETIGTPDEFVEDYMKDRQGSYIPARLLRRTPGYLRDLMNQFSLSYFHILLMLLLLLISQRFVLWVSWFIFRDIRQDPLDYEGIYGYQVTQIQFLVFLSGYILVVLFLVWVLLVRTKDLSLAQIEKIFIYSSFVAILSAAFNIYGTDNVWIDLIEFGARYNILVLPLVLFVLIPTGVATGYQIRFLSKAWKQNKEIMQSDPFQIK